MAIASAAGVLSGILLVNAADQLEAARSLMTRRPETAGIQAELERLGPALDLASLPV